MAMLTKVPQLLARLDPDLKLVSQRVGPTSPFSLFAAA